MMAEINNDKIIQFYELFFQMIHDKKHLLPDDEL